MKKKKKKKENLMDKLVSLGKKGSKFSNNLEEGMSEALGGDSFKF